MREVYYVPEQRSCNTRLRKYYETTEMVPGKQAESTHGVLVNRKQKWCARDTTEERLIGLVTD